MRRDEPGRETHAQAKQRADRLRRHAAKARRVADALATYLDKDAAEADAHPVIWSGPYAKSTTEMLKHRSRTLDEMAADLRRDARRWDDEADRVEEHAAKAARNAHAARA